MTPRRLRLVAATGAAVLLTSPVAALPSSALAPTAPMAAAATTATPLTVAQALDGQDGSTQTVRGYVVGQPVSSDRVVTSDFRSDYAIAIAASPDETDTSRMVYVQVPSALRAQWGL